MHHSFDITIAEKFGVNVAIFLNNMAFWIVKNQASEKHFYDGRYWTYNSAKSYSILFPYWTEKQIRTVIDHCLSHGLIVKNKYNKSAYDQTQWYGFTDLGHKLLNIPILPNGKIEVTEQEDQSHQTVRPIPDINTDINTDKREGALRRERKKRVPLSVTFKPSLENQAALEETAQKSGLSKEKLLEKFYRLAKASDKTSDDWQNEFALYLLREQPVFNFTPKQYPQQEMKSTVKWFNDNH